MGKKRVANKITANQFRQMRDGNVAVMFFKESCPWCREFKPKWNKAAKQMQVKSGDLNVPIVKLDVNAAPFVVQEVGFITVPTTVFYKKGKEPYFYEGSREADDVWKALDSYYREDEKPPTPHGGPSIFPIREQIREQIRQQMGSAPPAAQVMETQPQYAPRAPLAPSGLDRFLAWLGIEDDGDDI